MIDKLKRINIRRFRISNPVKGEDGTKYILVQTVGERIILFNSPPNGVYKEIAKYSYKETTSKMITNETLIEVLGGLVGEDVIRELVIPSKNGIRGITDEEEYKEVIGTIINENVLLEEKDISMLELEILANVEKLKKPSNQLLSKWLRSKHDFRLHENGLKHYMATPNGYKEIDKNDIIELLVDVLGEGILNFRDASTLLEMVAQKRIKVNYNIVQFSNGILDTSTGEFTTGNECMEYLPKMECGFNFPTEHWEDWDRITEEYGNTPLKKEISNILSCDWEWNEDIFYYYLANCLMATNELERLLIIYGKSGTGKSTLATIIKRIFSGYDSAVKLQTINTNTTNGHDTSPLIGKCVNIDDDMGEQPLKDTGNIKSYVTGGGFTVNPKNKELVTLDMFTTPKFIGCTNTLPKFEGKGHKRRMLIIKANNKIDDGNESYQKNIMTGKRDDEISLLIQYSLKTYYELKKKGEAPVNQTIEDTIWDYYLEKLKTQNIPYSEHYREAITECFIGKNELSKQLNQLKEEGKIEDYKYKSSTLRIYHKGKWEEIPNYTFKEEAVEIITEHIEKNKGEDIKIKNNHISYMMKIDYEYKQKKIKGNNERVFTDCVNIEKVAKVAPYLEKVFRKKIIK